MIKIYCTDCKEPSMIFISCEGIINTKLKIKCLECGTIREEYC